MRYALTDTEWRLTEPILPCGARGVPRVDDKAGPEWHLLGLEVRSAVAGLPECNGRYTTCYIRFVRWRRAGV